MTATAYAWRSRYWCAVLSAEDVIRASRRHRASTWRVRVTYVDGVTRILMPWEIREIAKEVKACEP